jgi:hypothetical protein
MTSLARIHINDSSEETAVGDAWNGSDAVGSTRDTKCSSWEYQEIPSVGLGSTRDTKCSSWEYQGYQV